MSCEPEHLTIKRWAPKVRVVYDYYPFGLSWENPKLPNDPEGVHDHAYQDKEFQFAEFSTGHGLALYDFHARMYDPATGRWLVPDPAEQFANPYLAMANNPVSYVDPDGRLAWFVPVIIGAVSGAYTGGAIAAGDGGLSGANWNPFGGDQGSWQGTDWYKGAITGGIIGAGVGLGFSSGMAALNANAASAKWNITGIAGKGVKGFSSSGLTTKAWNITSNALMTANVNIASTWMQGGDLDAIYKSGLIGLAAGSAGGVVGNSMTTPRNAIPVEAFKAQNKVTSILNGAGDRLVRSIDADLPWNQVISNTILGAADGYAMSRFVNDDLWINKTIGPKDSYTHAFARYTSGFISQVGTSVPGVGLQIGSLYHTAMFTNYLAGSPAGFVIAGAMVNSLHSAGVALFGLTNAWEYYAQIGGFRPYTLWTR